jgi:hypothetical protein
MPSAPLFIPELAPTEAKLEAAEAVGADLDVGTGSGDGTDAGGRARPVQGFSRRCHRAARLSGGSPSVMEG